ncbi:MAG: type II toxin-antitoxin system RelE/ParE family toxin [Polyangiaceae bacterium]|nr:type II toxin-antitoxin system RelE/ParE family toxin [Polyangiaceae bacterium]
MGSRPLDVLPDAADEALVAAEWYRRRSAKAAAAFQHEIRSAFDRIQQSPETWPRHHHGTRRVLLHRFPYEVVYRIFSEVILVVAIAHCRRRPGYWRKR